MSYNMDIDWFFNKDEIASLLYERCHGMDDPYHINDRHECPCIRCPFKEGTECGEITEDDWLEILQQNRPSIKEDEEYV